MCSRQGNKWEEREKVNVPIKDTTITIASKQGAL